MDKAWFINALEYYFTLEKKETLPLATTWVNLKGIMVNEKSQKKKKDKYYMASLIGGILKKKKKKSWT